MALSAIRQQQLIARELGKEGDATFAALVSDWWELHADRAYGSIRLRYLLTKLNAVDYLRQTSWEETDFKDDEVQISGNQKSLNLQRLRDDIEAEIKAEMSHQGAGIGPQVGELTTTTPLTNPNGEPDPNARRYRGDPLHPPLWRRPRG